MASKKSFIYILFIILIIIFFISLIYLVKASNVVGYTVIKTPISEETVNYDKLKHKYDVHKCTDVCKSELCDDYMVQRIHYDLCKECKKEGKCYDPNEGICKYCLDFRSCDTLYGCNGGELLEPSTNDCNQCW